MSMYKLRYQRNENVLVFLLATEAGDDCGGAWRKLHERVGHQDVQCMLAHQRHEHPLAGVGMAVRAQRDIGQQTGSGLLLGRR